MHTYFELKKMYEETWKDLNKNLVETVKKNFKQITREPYGHIKRDVFIYKHVNIKNRYYERTMKTKLFKI
jgi:hypothetical protein